MQPAAIGIVLDPEQKDHVLWVKRRDLNIWVLPGGGIDQKETPEDAVLREIKEESGLDVKLIRKAALYHPVNKWTGLSHVFVCQAIDRKFIPTDESTEVGFFPLNAIPNPHFPFHVDWLREAFRYPGMIERPFHEFSWKRVGLFLLKHPLILTKYFLSRIFT